MLQPLYETETGPNRTARPEPVQIDPGELAYGYVGRSGEVHTEALAADPFEAGAAVGVTAAAWRRASSAAHARCCCSRM